MPDYYDRLRETTVFQEQALYNTRGVTLGGQGEPQRIVAMIGTPSLLRLLQAQPIRGRLFTEEDGEIGKTHKAVLTYASWQQWFGGQDSAVGRDVRINGEPFAVVGVLPQGLRVPRSRRQALAAGRVHAPRRSRTTRATATTGRTSRG